MPSSATSRPEGEVLVMPQNNNNSMTTEETSSSNTPIITKKKVSESRPAKEALPRTELETFTRFSQCHLWKLMMSFYDRQGVDSWSQGIVPHFITSNAFIGKAYARVVSSFFADLNLDLSEPLYIIELGTGSGKFSHFFLSSLVSIKHLLPFPIDNIKYVMTDFTTKNFDFWKTHPALCDFVSSGLVDFAIFDATTDDCMTLYNSQTVLSKNQVVNPLVIVANYLFDTLFHDLFQVDISGSLREGLCSTGSSSSEEPDPLDPAIIKRLSNKFRYDDITTEYYDDSNKQSFNAILEWYQSYYASKKETATILVPIGAITAVDRITAFTSRPSLVLTGDKGHNNPEHFRGLSDPHIAIHGSFSVMVNYHAVGIYAASKGGFALHNPQEEASLKVSAFVLLPDNDNARDIQGEEALEDVCQHRAKAFPRLQAAFSQYLVDFGPNDFFVMQKCLKEEQRSNNGGGGGPSLKAVVALLKLSCWDPDVFYKFRDAILDQIPSAGSKLQRDLTAGMTRIWKNYYMLDHDKDIAFEIGRYFYGIRDFETALSYYQTSIDTVGSHHVTSHNMGLCHYSTGRIETSLSFFKEAVSQSSSYEKAKSWQSRVEKELEENASDPSITSQTINMKNGKTLTILASSNQNEKDPLC